MEISIYDEEKIIEIWLTEEEISSKELISLIKPFYKEYKAKNYLVALFGSGGNLLEGVRKQLLCDPVPADIKAH